MRTISGTPGRRILLSPISSLEHRFKIFPPIKEGIQRQKLGYQRGFKAISDHPRSNKSVQAPYQSGDNHAHMRLSLAFQVMFMI
jgi:hypothetical protein